MHFNSPKVFKVLLMMKEIQFVGHIGTSIKARQVHLPYAGVAAFSPKVVQARRYLAFIFWIFKLLAR